MRRRPQLPSSFNFHWLWVAATRRWKQALSMLLLSVAAVAVLLYTALWLTDGSRGGGQGRPGLLYDADRPADSADISSLVRSAAPASVSLPGCPPPSSSSPSVLFLRGFPKSGTSWLRSLVGKHPAVVLLKKELSLSVLSKPLEHFTSAPWAAADPHLSSLVHRWYDELVRCLLTADLRHKPHPRTGLPVTPVWAGEKTPATLSPLFPNATYVYIVRDGRDALVSVLFHHVNLGGFSDGGWCSGDERLVEEDDLLRFKQDAAYFDSNPHRLLAKEKCVRAIARTWAERLRQDSDSIAAISQPQRNALGNRVKVVRYEAMLNATQAELDAIFSFLRLDPADAQPLLDSDHTTPGFRADQRRSAFFRKVEASSCPTLTRALPAP